MPNHTYARYWMEPDLTEHTEARAAFSPLPERGGVFNMVIARQHENDSMPDPEDKEGLNDVGAKLPGRGAQVHFVYTVHAHFRLLERLLLKSAKARFFMDQDETLRAGCLSAFAWKVKIGRADAFYVRINKQLGIDTKRKMVVNSKMKSDAFRKAFNHPDWPDHRVRLYMIRAASPNIQKRKGFRDAWLMYPEYTINEPEKAVAYLTDRGDYGLDHLAALYSRATMHAIDRYFMQIRRLLMMLERPISRAGKATWSGYSPYNPTIIQKLLDIFRVHYNYCKTEERARKDAAGKLLPKRTPAMKLGLAKGVIRIEDVLYFIREKHSD